MTQQTSIDAYAIIKSNGLLNELQFKVYEVVKKCGPITQGEAWSEHFSDSQRHTVAPRFAELAKLGVIHSVGTRKDRFSGVETMTWEVTNSLPSKPKISKLKRQEQAFEVRKLLRDIYWHTQHNVPLDLKDLEDRSKRVLTILETGVDPNEPA